MKILSAFIMLFLYPRKMRLPRPKLSSRMLTFIEHAVIGAPFWDVCCDHGYVGIKALETRLFPVVHFVDQVPHIMDRLKTLIEQSREGSLHSHYFLYSSSGEDLEENVEGTLLIAGVGGLTIKTILESLINKDKLKAQRLLLSPHTDERVLVDYMSNENFKTLYRPTEKILIPEGKRHRPLYLLDLKVGQA